jgi:hypothetical protein
MCRTIYALSAIWRGQVEKNKEEEQNQAELLWATCNIIKRGGFLANKKSEEKRLRTRAAK